MYFFFPPGVICESNSLTHRQGFYMGSNCVTSAHFAVLTERQRLGLIGEKELLSPPKMVQELWTLPQWSWWSVVDKWLSLPCHTSTFTVHIQGCLLQKRTERATAELPITNQFLEKSSFRLIVSLVGTSFFSVHVTTCFEKCWWKSAPQVEVWLMQCTYEAQCQRCENEKCGYCLCLRV